MGNLDEIAAALARIRELRTGPEDEWNRLFSDAASRALAAGATLMEINEASEGRFPPRSARPE